MPKAKTLWERANASLVIGKHETGLTPQQIEDFASILDICFKYHTYDWPTIFREEAERRVRISVVQPKRKKGKK